MRYEVSDFAEANELFHRNGWTDGLPVIPPTPERVASFLEAAGLEAEDRIGFYRERRLPILAGKLAVNAVMAGCLPDYFPVVVAIVEAMLDADFPIHVVNSSTGSFTLGFIINGPVRQALGMNCSGNMLGPGNRANSTIGRAIRLIQLNVMRSIPGAGGAEPEHGRPVLDRSMMGQPAKYAGYHIVENEEAYPALKPLHVELGFEPADSTVTLLMVAGYHWICAHGEQTPEEWVDTMAHYVVGAGMLHEQGYGALLLPLENARLFAKAGWSKADIRQALYERTRRSVAWVKSNGWKVTLQRRRFEPVEPGDEERFLAMAGSPGPQDLLVTVCGGPAGSWPYYLYGGGGPAKAITRRIRFREAASTVSPAIVQALEPLRAMLAADGYALSLRIEGGNHLIARIDAESSVCADCLVSKDIMRRYVEEALRAASSAAPPSFVLEYPKDH